MCFSTHFSPKAKTKPTRGHCHYFMYLVVSRSIKHNLYNKSEELGSNPVFPYSYYSQNNKKVIVLSKLKLLQVHFCGLQMSQEISLLKIFLLAKQIMVICMTSLTENLYWF